jgi:hypothetical protein
MSNSSAKDDFEDSLYHFVEAVKVLASPPEEQCEAMGNYNVAWEIQHDVWEGGLALVELEASTLNSRQSDKIIALAERLQKLPEGAIAPPGMPTTNHEGSLAAMKHSAWVSLRRDALDLLETLEPAIRNNANYWKDQGI